MKRPGVVWVFSVLLFIGILNNLYSGIIQVTRPNVWAIIIGVIVLLLEVPWAILLINFFTLKKKAELWTHISFGSIIVLAIIQYVMIFAIIGPLGTAILAPPSIIVLAIYAFVWWAVFDYIKKKQIDGQQLFN
jgi:hypothetical protein